MALYADSITRNQLYKGGATFFGEVHLITHETLVVAVTHDPTAQLQPSNTSKLLSELI